MAEFRHMRPVEIIERGATRIECSIVTPDSDDDRLRVWDTPSWIARVYEDNGRTFADVGNLIFLKAGEHNPFHSSATHDIATDILSFFNEDGIPPESNFVAKTICDVLRETNAASITPSYLNDFATTEGDNIDPIKLRSMSDRWSMPFSEKIMKELETTKSEHAFVVYQGVCYDYGSPEGQTKGPFELTEILREIGEVIRNRGEHFENTLKAQNPGYVRRALAASEPQPEEPAQSLSTPSI